MNRDVMIVAVLFVLSVAAGVAVMQGSSDDRPNVIVISIDNLRADRLTAYGSERATTPRLQPFLNESIMFENAIAAGVYTLTSHGSLFTSQYPTAHGLREPSDRLPDERTTMAEALRDEGYRTGAFVGNNRTGGGHMKRRYGLDQGFDTYHADGLYLDSTIPAAQRWMAQDRGEPFFAFIHGYDVHAPYRADEPYLGRYSRNYSGVLRNYSLRFDPNTTEDVLDDIKSVDGRPVIETDNTTIPLSERDMQFIRDRYDETVLQADARLARLMDWLDEQGLMEESIVVLLAPEGENLGDHVGTRSRLIGHELPFEHTIRVPLAIHLPDGRGDDVVDQVSLIDLMPTVFDMVDVRPDPDTAKQMQGRSFLPLLRGETNKSIRPYAYSEAYPTPAFAVRTDRWKFIDMSQVIDMESRLYDMRLDPHEQRNLFEEQPQTASRLQQRLAEKRVESRYRRSDD